MSAGDVRSRDLAALLHPVTNLALHEECGPLMIERGEGIHVYDNTGKEYIEGLAGLWCTALGYGVEELAETAAPLSVASTKKLLWESPGLGPEDVERKETALHHVLMGAPDAVEGGVAYVERRKPEWKLRVSRDWPDWPR